MATKIVKANVLDTCLHMAGYRNNNNPAQIAGLFEDFAEYESQQFGEYVDFRVHVQKKSLAELNLQDTPNSITHNGSAGESFRHDLYFVEFSDSTIEKVKPSLKAGSNYAYTDTICEDGETISWCLHRINKPVKRVISIQWDYSGWDGQDTERCREVTIYE